jgi:hypothetical protein
MDLHEIIYSRGDVKSSGREAQLAIHDACNCGFVHRECHKWAEGGRGRMRGIAYLLRYEGRTRLIQFILHMSELGMLDNQRFIYDVNQVWSKLISMTDELYGRV